MITLKDCTRIGCITRLHGLNGSVIVRSEEFYLDEFEGEPVFLVLEGRPVPFFITEGSVRSRGGDSWIVHFDDVDSQKAAERILDTEIYVPSDELEEGEPDAVLPPVAGYAVVEEKRGLEGRVEDIIDYSGNIVLDIVFQDREVMLPYVDQYVIRIDNSGHKIYVSVPDEFFFLNR